MEGREFFRRQLTDERLLDDELYDLMRMSKENQAFHFNAWVERWGEHRKFACTASDSENLEAIRKFGDYAPDFVFRENSLFNDITDCYFLYESQMRITSMFPPEPYYSELIGADVALYDALSITAGGLYLDKGHTESQLNFASEYRKLPAVKFNDLPGYSDPVCVRWLDLDGRTYVYTLNREPYSIEISFECGSASENTTLDPFELKVFIYEGEFMPAVSSVKLPHSAVSAYQKEAQVAMDALRSNADTSKEWSKGVSAVSKQLKAVLENGEYSKLRYLLSSYVVKAVLLNTSL